LEDAVERPGVFHIARVRGDDLIAPPRRTAAVYAITISRRPASSIPRRSAQFTTIRVLPFSIRAHIVSRNSATPSSAVNVPSSFTTVAAPLVRVVMSIGVSGGQYSANEASD
jgi:hypothetical protein